MKTFKQILNESENISDNKLKNKISWFLDAYKRDDWPKMSSYIDSINKFMKDNKDKLSPKIVDAFQKIAIQNGKITNNSMKKFCDFIKKMK